MEDAEARRNKPQGSPALPAAPSTATSKPQTSPVVLAATKAADLRGNRIDQLQPNAPELATRGLNPIGVRTLALSNPAQFDVLVALAPGVKVILIPPCIFH